MLVGIVALTAVSTWLLHNNEVATWSLAIISLGIILIFARETFMDERGCTA